MFDPPPLRRLFSCLGSGGGFILINFHLLTVCDQLVLLLNIPLVKWLESSGQRIGAD